MTRLYYCRSIYEGENSRHINPLILQKEHHGSMLVLVSREQHQAKVIEAVEPYDGIDLTCIGWWDLPEYGFIGEDGFLLRELVRTYNTVVIVDADRIDERFIPTYQELVRTIQCDE